MAANAERRTYWATQMDAAYAFMQQILDYPVAECGEPLVSLRDAASAAGVTVAFSDTLLAARFERQFYLRQGLIPGFMAAAREMNARGWVIKVEDGYRSRTMQKALTIAPYVLDVILRRVIWELDGRTPDADLLFRRQTALTATIPKIGTHMSGSAIDISVLRREDGQEVDRGGPYIELSELTPMASPFVSPAARQNRAEITALMARHGFAHYPWEFWHYSGGDAYTELLAASGRPGRYGAVDFDPAGGTMVPVPDPKTPLHSPAEIRKNLELALARMR